MDQDRFDRISQVLGTATSRRAGIFGAIGTALGLVAAPAADAARKATRRHEKLACRNANSQCISDDECCSGSCVPKFGGTEFRCAKRHAKKDKKKDKGGDSPAPVVCTVCASGCAFTTIEDAIAAADSYAVITVAPGTYDPIPAAGNALGVIQVDKNVAIVACDPHNPPVIVNTHSTGQYMLFFVGGLDEQDSCTDAGFRFVIDGFEINGSTQSGRSAIFVSCNASMTISNTVIDGFGPTSFTKQGFSPIVLAATGFLDIYDSIIRNCDTTGPWNIGSAIQNFLWTDVGLNNYVTLTNTDVTNNIGRNGPISTGQYGTMTRKGTTSVHSNSATDGNGGGVFVDGPYSELFIQENASISGNSTTNGTGGGIYAGAPATVTGATASNVVNNTANSCNNFYDADTSSCVIV